MLDREFLNRANIVVKSDGAALSDALPAVQREAHAALILILDTKQGDIDDIPLRSPAACLRSFLFNRHYDWALPVRVCYCVCARTYAYPAANSRIPANWSIS